MESPLPFLKRGGRRRTAPHGTEGVAGGRFRRRVGDRGEGQGAFCRRGCPPALPLFAKKPRKSRRRRLRFLEGPRRPRCPTPSPPAISARSVPGGGGGPPARPQARGWWGGGVSQEGFPARDPRPRPAARQPRLGPESPRIPSLAHVERSVALGAALSSARAVPRPFHSKAEAKGQGGSKRAGEGGWGRRKGRERWRENGGACGCCGPLPVAEAPWQWGLRMEESTGSRNL